MRAIVVGAVESSRIAVETIAHASGWELPLVVSLPPGLAQRHSDFVDLSAVAEQAGATMLHAADINAPDICEAIAAAEPDYVFIIGWSQICGPELMSIAPSRMIGYHPTALPRMRGRAVIPWTILSNEAITGSTLFWIDEGVDTGAILEQEFLHIAPDETAATLYARHVQVLRKMLAKALADLAAGTARREPQDERFATWVARRTAECGRIDWTLPARDTERLIRAVGRPYPGARTRMPSRGHDLVIWNARVAADGARHLARPGQVVARDGAQFTVMCGDHSTIEVLDWDSPDGRPPVMHMVLGQGAC